MNINAQFEWKCHPLAEKLQLQFLAKAIQQNHFIAKLERDLLTITSTRLFDWIDYFTLSYNEHLEKELEDSGFQSIHTTAGYRLFSHPGAQLPRVALKDSQDPLIEVAVSVDSIADFLMVHQLHGLIEGVPLSPYRKCLLSNEGNAALWVIERRGTDLIEPVKNFESFLYIDALEKWKTRPRDGENEEYLLHQALNLAKEIVLTLGENIAASVVLEAERQYWQAKNTAGQIQKNRQDRLGMGWANHDHHTFRSSRRHFATLVRLFEILGFHCRERYYTGKEAGWGAQIMENPVARLVLFLDVDLGPHEIEIDFAHHPLPERDSLGTIGLWCALHGDSILQAGMHHLEAQFMFDELKQDLANQGVKMMDPFSHFPYLKQAFTVGEMWPIDPKRIELLLQQELITEQDAEKFLTQGAIGSHMENLQRREGYKGFNQKNVSLIIKRTDPRIHS